MKRKPHRSGLRLWLVPMAILGGIALIIFVSLYTLDHHVTGGISDPHPASAPGRYFRFEPSLISDALSGLAGMTAAVLGIVITVVSLLVQLTSERYTGVAQMFLRDRRNVAVMAYYVVTCVVGVALSLSLHNEFVPRAAVFCMMCACAVGLIMMLPYFAYVFRFLEPVNLIARIESEAAADVAQAAYYAQIILNPARDELHALVEANKKREVAPPPGMPIGSQGEDCWYCETVALAR